MENEEPVLVKRTISEETSTLVKDYMRGVVQNGSGKLADLEGYEVGGKDWYSRETSKIRRKEPGIFLLDMHPRKIRRLQFML